jgi:hypothetical protein
LSDGHTYADSDGHTHADSDAYTDGPPYFCAANGNANGHPDANAH